MKSLLLNLLLVISLALFTSQVKGKDSLSSMGKRFAAGFSKGEGSIRDSMIEGSIEAVTPDADEGVRKIQRSAVKYMLSSGPNKDRHWDDMHRSMAEYARASSRTIKLREYNTVTVNRVKSLSGLSAKSGPIMNSRTCNDISGEYYGSANYGSYKSLSGMPYLKNMTVIIKKRPTVKRTRTPKALSWWEEVMYKFVGDPPSIENVIIYEGYVEVAGTQLYDQHYNLDVHFKDNVVSFVATEDWYKFDRLRVKKGETLLAVLLNCRERAGVLQWGAINHGSLF